MTTPNRYFSVAEAANLSNTTPSVLRIWELRYGYPRPIRNPKNGYRCYTIAQIEYLIEFIKAGKPFKDIENGVWFPPSKLERPNNAKYGYESFNVEKPFLNALKNHNQSRIRFYLASMGRLRPKERDEYIACIQHANHEQHGIFKNIMIEYGIKPNDASTHQLRQTEEGGNTKCDTKDGGLNPS